MRQIPFITLVIFLISGCEKVEKDGFRLTPEQQVYESVFNSVRLWVS